MYWWQNQDDFFIAMEYCEHGDLSRMIGDLSTANTKSCEWEVSLIVRQLTFAIYFLHEAKFAHRDIKPKVGTSCLYNYPSNMNSNNNIRISSLRSA